MTTQYYDTLYEALDEMSMLINRKHVSEDIVDAYHKYFKRYPIEQVTAAIQKYTDAPPGKGGRKYFPRADELKEIIKRHRYQRMNISVSRYEAENMRKRLSEAGKPLLRDVVGQRMCHIYNLGRHHGIQPRQQQIFNLLSETAEVLDVVFQSFIHFCRDLDHFPGIQTFVVDFVPQCGVDERGQLRGLTFNEWCDRAGGVEKKFRELGLSNEIGWDMKKRYEKGRSSIDELAERKRGKT
ncbi:MAG: hypothetical protein DRJ03_02795 [Chloroflexi bacterium]|nr:MAG: hypothetical protein DRJ03_02795 [Chloroflexota bacterium]